MHAGPPPSGIRLLRRTTADGVNNGRICEGEEKRREKKIESFPLVRGPLSPFLPFDILIHRVLVVDAPPGLGWRRHRERTWRRR